MFFVFSQKVKIGLKFLDAVIPFNLYFEYKCNENTNSFLLRVSEDHKSSVGYNRR